MSLRRVLIAILVVVLILILLDVLTAGRGSGQVPPQDPTQPHNDIFSCGVPDCRLYNPVTVEAMNTRAVQYRLVINPGCTAGQIVSDLNIVSGWLDQYFGFQLQRDDSNADFDIIVNCGINHLNVCGSVNIFCLGYGFPGNPDVSLSDIMYTPYQWPEITRTSVICHEVCGHAIGTWDEQYCKGGISYPVGHRCRGLAQFVSAPGWVDFMNTGVNSRHGFTFIEWARWQRTLYSLQPPPPEPVCDSDANYGDPRGRVWCLEADGLWHLPITTTYGAVQEWRFKPGDTERGWYCVAGCP